MEDFIIRTEDILPENILDIYVETEKDQNIVQSLKNRSPVLLEGSRGVGKSFLLRVAEQQLLETLNTEGTLPVYVKLTKSILVRTKNDNQFRFWTLCRLTNALLRSLRNTGLIADLDRDSGALGGQIGGEDPVNETLREFEESYQNPGQEVDISEVPTAVNFTHAIEDICRRLSIERISVFFDEAAHILQPEHQRQFFSLFRDLRTPRIACNAAVYPGITAYGEDFERSHDATVKRVERRVESTNYIDKMKEIVYAQADDSTAREIEDNERDFEVLAYAASGNPRYLLESLQKYPDTRNATEVVKDHFRNDIWAGHKGLREKYGGLGDLIEWGEEFMKRKVLPSLEDKNEGGGNTSRYFWIRDGAPEFVDKSLQLLMYMGIVSPDKEGYIATNDWKGTRYAVNLGVLYADASHPAGECIRIAENLSVSKPALFNKNHPAFEGLEAESVVFGQDNEVLNEMLDRSIDNLDLTEFKKMRLRQQNITTIGEVLDSSEEILKQGYYVGDVRARKIKNAAQAAVMEYLHG
jgi:hypothetical protein